MNPRIEVLASKKVIGLNMKMSLQNNSTGELWSTFMQRHKEIANAISNDKISLQVYPSSYFGQYNPNAEFVKWAGVEVTNFDNLPEGMDTFQIPSGLYAVFDYKGLSSDRSIFRYIYSIWLPKSKYSLDQRPHFEILGKNYKNNHPDSEEEIWIPVRLK